MNAKAVVLASAALALTTAACGRPGPFPAREAQAGAEAPDPGYRAAPQVSGAAMDSSGAMTLNGRALPSSRVQIVSPAGARIETSANGSGLWAASIGPLSEPVLYSLEEETRGQTVQAEGYVAVLPGAPAVALLRAGFGAEVMRGAGKAGLEILAVDYDAAGAAVVSGRAPPASPVRVLADGQPPVEGAAGPDGRFSLTLSKPLPTGVHRLQALTPKGEARVEFTVTPPAPPKGAPYHAQPLSFGWRVDWITPGGGVQTTVVLAG